MAEVVRIERGATTLPGGFDLLREYVSAGHRALPDSLTALSQTPQKIGRKSTTDATFDQMLKDPEVSASFESFRELALADGITLLASHSEDDDQHAAMSATVKQFCEDLRKGLATPLESTAKQLLKSIAYGHKVAEKVYEYRFWTDTSNPDVTPEPKLALMPRRLAVKPRQSTAFVVNAAGEVVGLVAARLDKGLSQTTPVTGTQVAEADIIPLEKFVVMTVRPDDDDPRGTSFLEAAFVPWDFKTQMQPQWFRWLMIFAVPPLIGKTAPGAVKVPKLDDAGMPVTDSNGAVVMLTPSQALLYQMLTFSEGGMAIAVPNGSDVTPLTVSAGGSVFREIEDAKNAEIRKAVTCTTLVTGEGQHESRAASQTQLQGIFDILVWSLKGLVAEVLRCQVFEHAVALNFGEEAAKLYTPTVHLGDMQTQEFGTGASAVASLWSAGFLHPSQLAGIDAMIGLPERSDPEEFMGWGGGAQGQPEGAEAGEPPDTNDGEDDGEDDGEPSDAPDPNDAEDPQPEDKGDGQ